MTFIRSDQMAEFLGVKKDSFRYRAEAFAPVRERYIEGRFTLGDAVAFAALEDLDRNGQQKLSQRYVDNLFAVCQDLKLWKLPSSTLAFDEHSDQVAFVPEDDADLRLATLQQSVTKVDLQAIAHRLMRFQLFDASTRWIEDSDPKADAEYQRSKLFVPRALTKPKKSFF